MDVRPFILFIFERSIMKKFFLFMLIFALSFAIAQGIDTTHVTILHTNDTHGHLLPFNISGQKQVGGIAPRATFIKEVRKEMQDKKGHLLLLDCGDVNTGQPLSSMLKAEPDIRAMNLIGYDALVAGNHEFDLKLEDLLKQSSLAKFPYLSANVIHKKTKSFLFSRYKIFHLGNIRIACFGITTPDTPNISTHGGDGDLIFLSHRRVIPEMIQKLRPKADLIIAVMHMAHDRVLRVVKNFPEIDIVIGGHTHFGTLQPVRVGKTLVVEADCHGRVVGRFDLKFQKKKLVSWKYQPVGINLSKPLRDKGTNKIICYPYKKRFKPDPEIEKLLAPYVNKISAILDQAIGYAKTDILKADRSKYPYSMPLGNMITDAIREFVKSDIALQNIGGIRADLLKGKVTHRHVKTILPFTNTIFVYKFTGTQLRELIELMARRNPSKGGVFETSGLRFKVKNRKPIGVRVNGKKIEENRIYTLATNSFIGNGGNNYSFFTKFTPVDTGYSLSTAFAYYIKKHTPISANPEIRYQWIQPEK